MAELKIEDLVCVREPRVAYDFRGQVSNANGAYPATVVGARPEAFGAPVSVRGWGNVVGSFLFRGRRHPGPRRRASRPRLVRDRDGDQDLFADTPADRSRSHEPHGGHRHVLRALAAHHRTEGQSSWQHPHRSCGLQSLRGWRRRGRDRRGRDRGAQPGAGVGGGLRADLHSHRSVGACRDDLHRRRPGAAPGRRGGGSARVPGRAARPVDTRRRARRLCFVGTASDGADYQFAGRLGGIRIWDGVPAVYHDALARAAQAGLGAIASRYDDIPDAGRVLGKPTPGPTEVEGGTVEGSAGEEEVLVLGKTTGRIRTYEEGCIIS